jgi:hypothetical protein
MIQRTWNLGNSRSPRSPRPSRGDVGRIVLLACAAASWLCASASADMTIAGGSDFFNQSDRFYSGTTPPKDFAFSQFDFSPVGNTNGAAGTGNWATLISPDFVLSANHGGGHPSGGETVTFETTNNIGGPTVSFTTGPGMEVGNTDLFLQKLTTSTAGSGITPVAVASDDEATQVGAKIIGVGIPWRVGTNNIDLFATAGTDFMSPSPPEGGRTFLYDFNTKVSPFENMLQGGDSGGPSFLVNPDNQLLLVGIHWFNFSADPNNYTPNPGSGDSYVPADIAAINATMQLLDPGTSDHVTVVPFAVPEPSSVALLALGGFGLVARGLRRRAPAG